MASLSHNYTSDQYGKPFCKMSLLVCLNTPVDFYMLCVEIQNKRVITLTDEKVLQQKECLCCMHNHNPDLQSNAEPLCAFDSTLKKWNLACRQAVMLICLDSCTVFFMLSETPTPLSAPVILRNWTSQQGWRTDDWTKRK